jgi:DNA-binding response OmpR family regulator
LFTVPALAIARRPRHTSPNPLSWNKFERWSLRWHVHCSVPRRRGFVKQRVLIIEDEALLARMLAQAFRERGYEVARAASAELAQAVLEETPGFDLILLDNRLPGQTGLDFLEEHGKPAGARVVLMTAYGTEETHRRSVQLGADLYLRKPFDLEAVMAKAAELVEKGAQAKA